MDTLDMLVFAAHPDDAEIGMGATIVKHVRAGFRVGICDLTKAELSSNGTPATRAEEASVASELLGLSARINLGLPDRGLRLETSQLDAIATVIRATRPRIVFAPYWVDRHPDHVMCGKLVEEALFNAKLRRYPLAGEVHSVEQFYRYFIHEPAQPNVIIDVSTVHERKIQALKAYRTQFLHMDNDRVVTPLNQGYLEQVVERDRLLGRRLGVTFAEGFVSHEPLQRTTFFD